MLKSILSEEVEAYSNHAECEHKEWQGGDGEFNGRHTLFVFQELFQSGLLASTWTAPSPDVGSRITNNLPLSRENSISAQSSVTAMNQFFRERKD